MDIRLVYTSRATFSTFTPDDLGAQHGGAVGRNPMVVTFLEQLCAAVASNSSGSGVLSVSVELRAGHWPGHWIGHWTLFLASVLAAR